MLTALFRRPHHLHRLRANPIGPFIDPFVGFLLQRGHSASVVHQYLRGVEHFGHWLGTCHPQATAEHITKEAVRLFLHDHLPTCSCSQGFPRSRIASRAALRHLLRMLALQEPARLSPSLTPHDGLLTAYDHFLHQTSGLSQHTCIYRLRNARAFLERLFGETALEPSRLQPAVLQDYFRLYAGHLKAGSVSVLASSLRSFLSFLALTQEVDPTLAVAVPTVPQWPQDRLPRALTNADLQAILASFDTQTATGRRDLAMIRCISDLGLRVGEVVPLTLDDIDWRQGVLTIRDGKGRRGRVLPLPAALGRARNFLSSSGQTNVG